MLLFSDRKKLEQAYYSYCEEVEREQDVKILDCPQSVVTFLMVNGLLNEDKVKEFLNNYEEELLWLEFISGCTSGKECRSCIKENIEFHVGEE